MSGEFSRPWMRRRRPVARWNGRLLGKHLGDISQHQI